MFYLLQSFVFCLSKCALCPGVCVGGLFVKLKQTKVFLISTNQIFVVMDSTIKSLLFVKSGRRLNTFESFFFCETRFAYNANESPLVWITRPFWSFCPKCKQAHHLVSVSVCGAEAKSICHIYYSISFDKATNEDKCFLHFLGAWCSSIRLPVLFSFKRTCWLCRKLNHWWLWWQCQWW